MPARTTTVSRKTRETDIQASLNLDGRGQVEIATGIGFLDHLLTAAMVHGFFDLYLKAKGDTHVDDHHTVEDVGIVLGQAFSQALGDFSGIRRIGQATVPMDEALAQAVVDLSRRPFLVFEAPFSGQWTGTFDAQLAEEFWRAFSVHCGATLHLEVHRGRNVHHQLEALFKAAGRALDQATSREDRAQGVVSTKGAL